MKIDSTFRIFAFLMAVLIFSMPVIIFAQQNPIETKATIEVAAKAQAIIDAENDANKTGWFMAGCFLNILGVAMARTKKAPVPAGRLVGKSLTYIVAYTSSYQTRRTEIQVQSAVLGCTLATLACVIVAYPIVKDGLEALEACGGCLAAASDSDIDSGSWCSPFF